MELRAYVPVSLASAASSVVLTLSSILTAVAVSPTFRWEQHALSNLGQPGSPVASPVTTALFDGGLVLGGILGLGFVIALWVAAVSTAHRLVVPIFIGMMVSLAGIGIFPQSQPAHFPAAVGFYLLSMIAMATDGVVRLLHGSRWLGSASLCFFLTHIGVWWAWSLEGPVVREGLAIPEMLGALVIIAWIALLVVTIRRQSTGQNTSQPIEQ